MPWVEFTEDFNWTPDHDRRQTTAYKVGHKVLVTRGCAEKAAGKFKRIRAPSRDEARLINTAEANPVRLGGHDAATDD
jgi:hypothetical protein